MHSRGAALTVVHMEHMVQLDAWQAVAEPPVGGSPEEQIEFALRCAILAPSTLLLRAQAAGVSASFLNQPVEDSALRPRLRKLLGGRGFPQLVLRLGYPREAARATPRRALQDVVL